MVSEGPTGFSTTNTKAASACRSKDSEGIGLTFRTLVRSENDTATDVLVAGLDVSVRSIQEKAIGALLERRDPRGHLAIISRWATWGDYFRQRICEKSDRLTGAITKALESDDPLLFQNVCQVAVAVREYSAIAALLRATGEQEPQRVRLAAQTVLDLAEALYDELVTPRDYRERRDPQRVRHHVVGSLELALIRAGAHIQPEIVEAFLLLANTDNPFLRRVLDETNHPLHAPVCQVFERSSRVGVFRLLLKYLETLAPAAALQLLAKRNDVPFLRRLARALSGDLTEVLRRNLGRIEHFAWFADLSGVWALADVEQAALVRAVSVCGAPAATVVQILGSFLEQGRPAAQRAAVAALANFTTPEADQWIVSALRSSEPGVQAEAARQLRQRDIPGSIAHLLSLVDSVHPEVREAVRASLTEFDTARFLQAFDLLSDEVRNTAGVLVRKLDPHTTDSLRQELTSPSRMRKLRGLQAATAMQAVPELQDEVLALLEDDDHFIRAEAARALAQTRGAHVVQALQLALQDRSPAVQAAAQQSLRLMSQRHAPLPANRTLPPESHSVSSPTRRATSGG